MIGALAEDLALPLQSANHKDLSVEEWREKLLLVRSSFMQRKLITVLDHGDGALLFVGSMGGSLLDALLQTVLAGTTKAQRVNHRLAIFDGHGAICEVYAQSDAVR